jgi:hypothetical protein
MATTPSYPALYDRLPEGHARPAREHLCAGLDDQSQLARFLENHDEPRAAATFVSGVHEAAAIVSYLSPGLRFIHQGQFEGRKKRISPHLVRAPIEPIDSQCRQFYASLLAVLRQSTVRDGQWRLLECVPGWDGNWTSDCFIACSWEGQDGQRRLGSASYDRDGSDLASRGLYLDLPRGSYHVFELTAL